VAFGTAPLQVPVPDLLSGGVPVMEGLLFSSYRLAIIATGLGIALRSGSWWSARRSAC
jgi:branched-chain amino acid transport system permease protein